MDDEAKEAVEFLEADEYMRNQAAERFTSILYTSPYSNANIYSRSTGVTARRPMFELIEDHESENADGDCYICNSIPTMPPPMRSTVENVMRVVASYDERGDLQRMRTT